MRKTRGLKLGGKLANAFNLAINRWKDPIAYERTDQTSVCDSIKETLKICKWLHFLKHRARGLLFPKSESSYIRAGRDRVEADLTVAPKGHLTVYVGEREGDMRKYLVPVIYFNHPLFKNLLRGAEEEYGFDHLGGIQIPCRVSEFENVKQGIAATSRGHHRKRGWRQLRF